ncbi:MAG: hypothetical protein JOZ19_16895 [Rubrobacter sp.]|nr:hypothetical protein [Rubrobacter sp.]
MQHFSEFEPERIVLKCRWCGEILVLIGREEDWRSEGRSSFQCECGESLTILANRVPGEYNIEQLLRRLGAPNGR